MLVWRPRCIRFVTTRVARSTGLPVNLLSLLIALLAAATVAVAMRSCGAATGNGLMIVPVAISQILVRPFRSTMVLAMTIGLVTTVVGLTITYFYNLSPALRLSCSQSRYTRWFSHFVL